MDRNELKAAARTTGRWAAAGAAAGFACLCYLYLTLPDVRPLRTSNPKTTAFIELRAREARAKGEKPRRIQRWVSYKSMSPNLTRAVLVAEDDLFWQHEGVDVEQMQESLEADWAKLRFIRGGSTITQQLAKNLYLSPSKNPVRKLRELIIARRLEAELDKSRILELYLNVIEWGDGIYGAEAAARTYFNVGAASLGPSEAALLAGAIVNPRVLNPAHPSARLISRQALIMRRMGSVTPPPPPSIDIGDNIDNIDIGGVNDSTDFLAPVPPPTSKSDRVTPSGDDPPANSPPPDYTPQPVSPDDRITDPKAVPD